MLERGSAAFAWNGLERVEPTRLARCPSLHTLPPHSSISPFLLSFPSLLSLTPQHPRIEASLRLMTAVLSSFDTLARSSNMASDENDIECDLLLLNLYHYVSLLTLSVTI